MHCSDDSLLGIAVVKRGHQAQSKWSQDFKKFECLGNDRLLDKCIKEAKAKEDAFIEREAKLAEYFKQP